MLVILATQEAEIRRIVVRSQPRQIVHENLSKIPNTNTHTHTHTQGWWSDSSVKCLPSKYKA
jgi:hypothetical protein